MYTVLLYTHNALPEKLERACFDQLHRAACAGYAEGGLFPHLLVVSSRPFEVAQGWDNVIVNGRPGYHDCYTKIVEGCKLARFTQVYLVEHDVLYPDGYFAFQPPRERAFFFNRNVWRLNKAGWFPCPGQLTSNCCAHRDLLIEQFTARVRLLDGGGKVKWDEPGRNPGDIAPMLDWVPSSRHACIDVRGDWNMTGNRTATNYIQTLPYWGNARQWAERLGL